MGGRIASGDATTTPSGNPVPATMPALLPATMPALHLGNDDEFWSIKTVYQKTGLSRASIYRCVARNLFPARRLHRSWPDRLVGVRGAVLDAESASSWHAFVRFTSHAC
jgi:Prophage CP4-57 regulatory protein (AlpA)